MPTPFPGIDLYLEQAGLWQEVHTRLIVAIADALGPMVWPHYRVAVEQRSYLAMVASDETVIVPDILAVDREAQARAGLPPSSQFESSAESGVFGGGAAKRKSPARVSSP